MSEGIRDDTASSGPRSMIMSAATVAVVTGAGRGIGREITALLAAAGHTMLATDVNESLLAETCGGLPGRVETARLDVRRAEEHRAVARRAEEHRAVARRAEELGRQCGSTMPASCRPVRQPPSPMTSSNAWSPSISWESCTAAGQRSR
jgi:NAD(P)-dependent dehydrogenase (short-subunit alcohol dehydrogenase family)